MRFNAFNFAGMKKSTIWVLGIVMGLSFLSLLYLQVSYIEEMVKMRKGQFDESVQRSLVQACRNIELVETKKYLEDDAIATEKAAQLSREQSEEKKGEGSGDVVAHTHEYSITSDGLNGYSTFELKMRFSANRPSNIPKAIISTGKNIPQTSRALQEIIKDRYVYQRALLDEVVYNILYTASDKPLNKRINFKQLDLFLKTELLNNGIDIPYHFTVTDRDGTEVYHCPDYTKEGSENTYPQVLFKNDPPARMATVNIHFPTLNSYIFSSVKFMIPSLIFTFVLLVTFIFTIYIIFRQKKLTEIKNDFINNMTHEFKTPISTISLAAQMLKDPAVGKSPAMFQHISGRRSRIQIYKILRLDQRCRISCDLLFFLDIKLGFLGYSRLISIDCMLQCHCAAKNPGQFSCLVKCCDISANRGFRCIQDIFQFCYRDTVFFSEKAEYDLISLLRQHVFPPLKKTPRSAGPGCLLFTHSEITGSPA